MKFVNIIFFMSLITISVFAQNENERGELIHEKISYKPSLGTNGFEIANIEIRYRFVNCFGDLNIGVAVKSKVNATAYWYNNKRYTTFTLNDPSLFQNLNISGLSVNGDIYFDQQLLKSFDFKYITNYDVGCFGDVKTVLEEWRKRNDIKSYRYRNIKVISERLGDSRKYDIEKKIKSYEAQILINDAKTLLEQGDVNGTKAKLNEARKMDSSQETKDKINELNDDILEEEKRERYNELIANADQSTDLNRKKELLSEAILLYPDEQEVLQKMRAVEREIEAKNEQNGSDLNNDNELDKNTKEEEPSKTTETSEQKKKKLEEEKKRKQQEEYDEWKNKAKEQNAEVVAAYAASTMTFAIFLGKIMYANLGKVNPEVAFIPLESDFYLGLEFGFGVTNMPIIWNSDISTMRNGESVSEEEITKRNSFTLDFNLRFRFGYERPQYGGYAYFEPVFGMSPLFDSFQFSPLRGGGRVFGGLSQIKLFYDFGTGQRRYSKPYDIIDPEEYGSGLSIHNFYRHKFGLSYTFNDKESFIRNHLSVGLIFERLSLANFDIFDDQYEGQENDFEVQILNDDRNGFYRTNNDIRDQYITGVYFQYKKDQWFNLFINVFANYPFHGEAKFRKGDDFTGDSADKGGAFVEIGFSRALDFWSSKSMREKERSKYK